jgi:hypothetical protein
MGALRVFMFVFTSKAGLRRWCAVALRRRDLDNLLAFKTEEFGIYRINQKSNAKVQGKRG